MECNLLINWENCAKQHWKSGGGGSESQSCRALSSIEFPCSWNFLEQCDSDSVAVSDIACVILAALASHKEINYFFSDKTEIVLPQEERFCAGWFSSTISDNEPNKLIGDCIVNLVAGFQIKGLCLFWWKNIKGGFHNVNFPLGFFSENFSLAFPSQWDILHSLCLFELNHVEKDKRIRDCCERHLIEAADDKIWS